VVKILLFFFPLPKKEPKKAAAKEHLRLGSEVPAEKMEFSAL